MPEVKSAADLEAAYQATKRKMDVLPTTVIQGGDTILRAFNPESSYTSLPKPTAGQHVSRAKANLLMIPGSGTIELRNRFSGPSYNTAIPPVAALYCVLQQQALVNEMTHYSPYSAAWALKGRAVLKMYLMGTIRVAELSPHNPRSLRFLRELGKGMWDKMNDPEDCSVARGIALAIADSGYLRGIVVQTVRQSERSPEERGDNLVLFANPTEPVAGISIREVAYFGNKSHIPEIFPVAFP